MVFSLAAISTYASIPAILIAAYNFKKLSSELRFFAFFLVYALLTDVLCFNYANSNPVFNLYGVIEFLFYLVFLYQLNALGFKSKYILILIPLAFVLTYYCYFVLHDGFKDIELTSEWYGVSKGMIMAILTSFCLLNLAQFNSEITITQNYLFWIYTAIFIYFFTTNFIFGFISNTDLMEKVWPLHNVFNILSYILIAVGFIFAARNPK